MILHEQRLAGTAFGREEEEQSVRPAFARGTNERLPRSLRRSRQGPAFWPVNDFGGSTPPCAASPLCLQQPVRHLRSTAAGCGQEAT